MTPRRHRAGARVRAGLSSFFFTAHFLLRTLLLYWWATCCIYPVAPAARVDFYLRLPFGSSRLGHGSCADSHVRPKIDLVPRSYSDSRTENVGAGWLEGIMERAVGAKGIHPNVDFFSATSYYSMGLAIDLFTPVFALARNAGWAAHALERHEDNRLIRPRCNYTGPHAAPYVPNEDR